jgi:hypothetical protein
MIDGLSERSLYYKAYYLLRRPLIDMMFRGVAWDEKSAKAEKEKLSARKDEIKKLLDQLCGVPLYVVKEHRSDALFVLYSLQRDLRVDYKAIPKTDRAERKAFKVVVDGIGAAIRDCVDDGRGRSYEIGDGLSDQKIAAYLYGTLKLPPFKKRRKDSGKVTVTVDDTALKKTKMRFPEHVELIDLILEHRRCNKLVSTYLNADKLLSPRDGRFHSHYKPMGTQTGRLSSGSDPDSHGGNSQNIDREFKWLFTPK